MTARRSASLLREITEELRISEAWAAEADADADDAAPFHPYAVSLFAAARVAGVLRAFGVAYAIGEAE
jgi:hypothetical protein